MQPEFPTPITTESSTVAFNAGAGQTHFEVGGPFKVLPLSQTEITRCFKAMKKAGVLKGRIEITPDKVALIATHASAGALAAEGSPDLDALIQAIPDLEGEQ